VVTRYRILAIASLLFSTCYFLLAIASSHEPQQFAEDHYCPAAARQRGRLITDGVLGLWQQVSPMAY
jgi:hypothetical protein